jgi:transketolase
VDGHDVAALTEVLTNVPFAPGKPSLLIAETVKGKGVDFIENVVRYHNRGPLPGTDDAKRAFEQLEKRRAELVREVGNGN